VVARRLRTLEKEVFSLFEIKFQIITFQYFLPYFDSLILIFFNLVITTEISRSSTYTCLSLISLQTQTIS